MTRNPVILSDEAIDAFWTHLAKRRTLSNCALALILSTGARPSEVLSLRWAAFDGNGSLMLRTAKRADAPIRTAALSLVANELLDELLEAQASVAIPRATNYIFAHHGKSRPITGRALRFAAKRVGEAIGLPDLQPYDLRRTFATRVASHVGLRAAQDLLGHRSPNSTMRYIQPTKTDRQKAALLMAPSSSR